MAKTVDTLKKQPGETRLFGMSFSNKLNTGETIASIDSMVSDPAGDLTITDHSVSSGVANVLISGGVTGKTYKVTVTVTSSEGQILENDGWLEVLEL